MFDKRGTGLSDRHSIDTTLDVRMDDVRVVMDAVGSERAHIAAQSEGGPQAIVFAAAHPDRVSSLVLIGTAPCWKSAPGYPGGEWVERNIDIAGRSLQSWGSGQMLSSMAPSLGRDPQILEFFGGIERAMAGPTAVREILEWVRQIDVRAVLPTLTVPTLVLQRTGDVVIPDSIAQYLRDTIPNASYAEVPGPDHIPWIGDVGPLLDHIGEWITGAKTKVAADRILATVLFTDIVDSTKLAAQLGDRRWRETLQRHDDIAQKEIARFGGRLVKHTGDGLFATFPGPARGVQAARAINEAVRPLGIELRAGLHTGEVEMRGEDLGGIGVHIGSRVSGMARPNEVLVSSTVKDLVVGSGLRFEDRGDHELKGIPDQWRLFDVLLQERVARCRPKKRAKSSWLSPWA